MHLVCPEYRLRLFLSVDLVGSTAFKARVGETRKKSGYAPVWVEVIKHFYQDFPLSLSRNYEKLAKVEGENYVDDRPNVWKTIGDEIVFCCKIRNRIHLKICLDAFFRTLRGYGLYLDNEQKEHRLDVKATAWVAAFPAPNITIALDSADKKLVFEELKDETLESEADKLPRNFDFLGKHIDTGFRITKFALPDQMVVSLELAFLLSEIYQDTLSYNYLGRHQLKGVLSDKPYPIVTVIVERNVERKTLLDRERSLSVHTKVTNATHLRDFLDTFMQQEGVEFPQLVNDTEKKQDDHETYKGFKLHWNAEQQELVARERNEDSSANQESDTATQAELPDEVSSQLDEISQRAGKEEPSSSKSSAAVTLRG